jgi:branched-chain amino acid transport system ATP-binding protein
MHFCLRLARYATVIEKGQIGYTGSIEDQKANDNIRQRYPALSPTFVRPLFCLPT